MSTSVAIGIFTSKAKITTGTTFNNAYNFYNITTGSTDVTFAISSATIIPNKTYTIRKADVGIGIITIVDENSTELEVIYNQYNYCSVMYDGTNFLIL